MMGHLVLYRGGSEPDHVDRPRPSRSPPSTSLLLRVSAHLLHARPRTRRDGRSRQETPADSGSDQQHGSYKHGHGCRRTIDGKLDSEALARIVGTAGEQNGGVYKIAIGRADFTMKEMGATT